MSNLRDYCFRRNGKIARKEKTTTTKFHDRTKGFFWLKRPFFYLVKGKESGSKLPDLHQKNS